MCSFPRVKCAVGIAGCPCCFCSLAFLRTPDYPFSSVVLEAIFVDAMDLFPHLDLFLSYLAGFESTYKKKYILINTSLFLFS